MNPSHRNLAAGCLLASSLWGCGPSPLSPPGNPGRVTVDSWDLREGMYFRATGQKWDKPALSYRFLNRTHADAILRALDRWSQASHFSFSEAEEGEADLVFDWQSQPDPTSPGLLANARWSYADDGSLVHVSIVFSSSYSWSDAPEEGAYDIESIAVHEIGHSLGLDHSDMSQSFSPMLSSFFDQEVRRNLSVDEMKALQSIYGTRDFHAIASGDAISLLTRSDDCLSSNYRKGPVTARHACNPIRAQSNEILRVIKPGGGPIMSGDPVLIQTRAGYCWNFASQVEVVDSCNESWEESDELVRVMTQQGGALTSGQKIFLMSRSGTFASTPPGAPMSMRGSMGDEWGTSDELYEIIKFKE